MQRISERVGRQLERKGWLVRDAESTYLDSHLTLEADEEEASLKDLQDHSITYRIAPALSAFYAFCEVCAITRPAP